jgi:DNA modification methylase
MDVNSVDLIFTSPPYFNAKEYSHYNTYSDYLDWLKQVFSECYSVLKCGRMCCVNISVVIEPRVKQSEESKRIALPFHFVNLMETIGFKFLEDIIWVKPDGSAKNRNGRFFQDRQPVQYKPNIVNEYIFVFQKPMNGLIDKIVRNYTGDIKEKSLVKDGYERTNVWYINPETKSKHPAPFPLELSDKIIKYYSYVNDTVLDPFMGSGTTAISAINLNRNYIGFEKESIYCDMANKRINNTIK